MAKRWIEDSREIGGHASDDPAWAQPPWKKNQTEPLSKEWFRAHPQWATDRLMRWGKYRNES